MDIYKWLPTSKAPNVNIFASVGRFPSKRFVT